MRAKGWHWRQIADVSDVCDISELQVDGRHHRYPEQKLLDGRRDVYLSAVHGIRTIRVDTLYKNSLEGKTRDALFNELDEVIQIMGV